MTEAVYTHLLPLPMRVKGYTVLMEDTYTIVINSNLSDQARLEAYRHEIDHIRKDDFHRNDSVNDIERGAHSNGQ